MYTGSQESGASVDSQVKLPQLGPGHADFMVFWRVYCRPCLSVSGQDMRARFGEPVIQGTHHNFQM